MTHIRRRSAPSKEDITARLTAADIYELQSGSARLIRILEQNNAPQPFVPEMLIPSASHWIRALGEPLYAKLIYEGLLTTTINNPMVTCAGIVGISGRVTSTNLLMEHTKQMKGPEKRQGIRSSICKMC
ncbi:hypothetical protein E4T39_01810 [Aureobasidium subglaciale]|nr:hypothetical protein E4T39_01810 [Aureobasidium subglaciale]